MLQLFDTRPYTAADFDYANAMIESNMGHYLVLYDRVWDVGAFRKNMDEGVNRVIIYNGYDCGFYQYAINGSSTKLNFIEIDPAYQGKGIGTSVMKALEEEMKRMNISEIRLSVYPDNPALRLYTRLGYEIVKEEYPKIRMKKNL